MNTTVVPSTDTSIQEQNSNLASQVYEERKADKSEGRSKDEEPIISAPQAQSVQPSFDCSKASTRVEKIVCSNPKLAALDREMASNYKEARDAAADKVELKNEHMAWLKTLKQCPDEACLAQSYEQ